MRNIINISRGVLQDPVRFFVGAAAVFGAIFILVTPPLQGPDEQAHFVQVFKNSQGQFINRPGQTYPVSLKETYKTLFYSDDIRFHNTERYEHSRTRAALSIPLNSSERAEYDGYLTGTGYSPLGYMLSTALVFVGRMVNAPVVVLIYLARIGGLITWIAIIYWAIKISPIGKWPFALLGIFPMALYQASVVSVDTTALAAVILYCAYVFYLMKANQRISRKQYIFLALIGILAALGKHVMIFILPIALLLLANSERKKESPKKFMFVKVSLVLLVAALVLLGWSSLAGLNTPTTNVPNGVNAVDQVKNMVYNPTEFVYSLWNTHFHTWGDEITRSVVGTFGWMDTRMPLWVTICGYVIVFLALFSNRAKDIAALPVLGLKLTRLYLGLLILVFFLMVSAILYVFNSPVNYNIIVGLQGRYFLPILLLLIPLTVNKNQIVLKGTAQLVLMRICPVLLLAISAMYIFIRYYVNTLI